MCLFQSLLVYPTPVFDTSSLSLRLCLSLHYRLLWEKAVSKSSSWRWRNITIIRLSCVLPAPCCPTWRLPCRIWRRGPCIKVCDVAWHVMCMWYPCDTHVYQFIMYAVQLVVQYIGDDIMGHASRYVMWHVMCMWMWYPCDTHLIHIWYTSDNQIYNVCCPTWRPPCRRWRRGPCIKVCECCMWCACMWYPCDNHVYEIQLIICAVQQPIQYPYPFE